MWVKFYHHGDHRVHTLAPDASAGGAKPRVNLRVLCVLCGETARLTHNVGHSLRRQRAEGRKRRKRFNTKGTKEHKGKTEKKRLTAKLRSPRRKDGFKGQVKKRSTNTKEERGAKSKEQKAGSAGKDSPRRSPFASLRAGSVARRKSREQKAGSGRQRAESREQRTKIGEQEAESRK